MITQNKGKKTSLIKGKKIWASRASQTPKLCINKHCRSNPELAFQGVMTRMKSPGSWGQPPMFPRKLIGAKLLSG